MQVLLHTSDQPIFRLCVRSAQCMVEIRLSDVPIFCDVSGNSLSLELPVNEWLFQGANDLKVLLSPLEEGVAFGRDAGIEIALQYKFARDAARNCVDIGTLTWKPEPELPHAQHGGDAPEVDDVALLNETDEDAPLLALPGQAEELTWRISPPQKLRNKSVRLGSTLLLPPPWPVCPWSRGQTLPGDSRTHFAIQGAVRAYHQRLQHGGHEDFLKLRRAALESCYYLQPADVDEALGFPSLLRMKEWRLLPLPEKGLKLEVAGRGRLVRLLDEATAESPIVLVNETDGVAAVLDAWWMFNGEWLLIR